MKPASFPKVALENNVLRRCANNTVAGRTIYLWIILFVAFALMSLPFVSADIGVKGQSIIRPLTYKNIITAPISARVKAIFMEEN